MVRSAAKPRVSNHGPRDASFETPPAAAPQDAAEFLPPPFINIKSFKPYPRPQNLPYSDRVLSSEGRFMRRSEVGQSESLAGAG